MNRRQQFLEAADMAMANHAFSVKQAMQATTQDRKDYWWNEARDDEARARIYLRRAKWITEEQKQEEAA